ncbi:MAG: hypothetical protein K8F62_01295 [Pseudorhodoplanes sp.]|nr:hypothetical protein [Pseudorhodoplanes sp.]
MPKVAEGDIAKLKAENDAIILLYTSLNSSHGQHVGLTLARRDERGRYVVYRKGVPIKLSIDSSALPGQLKLPAGEYGIVELATIDTVVQGGVRGKRERAFRGSEEKLEGLDLQRVYDRALATFRVEPGEVVDIGTIEVFEGPTRPGAMLGLIPPRGSFGIKVGPIPERVLKNFAERSPDLARARIVRTMVAEAQPQ